ncbi:MAG TPA: bifunctional aspartate kinase/homoserine dehydrogenase I [Candidatus Didemnitutus sp.]|nr:bifunctional aspartate kinase/homoserine dehydrogenase I [Candidatus Didemnitutus sp.]
MNEKWQVYKFGGSSLGKAGRLPKVLDLIARGPRPLAVVVSALGDTTDWLILAARSAADGEIAQARGELGRVRELAMNTARPVLTAHGLRAFKADLDEVLTPVERMLSGIELTRECSPRSLDAVIHAGERISAALVSRAVSERDAPSIAADARDFVVTDANHGAAAVELTPTAEKFTAVRDKWNDIVPIVTGFIGRTKDGHTTTLGRNGSDYTATLLASLLQAESVTVWTDVLGVMTADPNLVREAAPVDRLSYDEALELAYFGTRMFHPRTIIPLRDCGAALVIRSTTQPEAPGTRIDATGNPDPSRPTCVTSLENLSLIGVQSRRTGPGRPIGSRILQALDGASVRVWMTTESTLGQTFSVVVPAADEERAQSILKKTLASELHHGDLSLGPVLTPVSLVTLVAESMGRRPNVAGRMLNAIGGVGIPVRALAQGASARSISCVVDSTDTTLAVSTVHTAFNLTHTELNVLLLGKGIVGGSLLKQLAGLGTKLRGEHDVQVRLAGLGGSKGDVFDPQGMAPDEAAKQLDRALADGKARRGVLEVLPDLSRLPNPVLVDCTAAAGMEEIYIAAFGHGINVVSANKQPLALPQPKRDALHTAARRHYRVYHYETTVGAALPVIETLKNLVRTGDRVVKIEGAFSGTLGFLCECLTGGEPLSAAVRRAKELGYTEPHPRDDLSGLDVARKALILARELGLRLDLSDVALTPFVPAEFLAEDDPEKFLQALVRADADMSARVTAFKAEGKLLRYLARIEPEAAGPKITVAPVGVEAPHPAATLRGAEAFVAFHTERYSQYPLVVRGAGAGGDVTAAGVLADILRLAQNIRGRKG